MLEKAVATTRRGEYTNVQYARFADDLVILIDAHPRHDWLVKAVNKRLREELAKLRVEINEEKSRMVDLAKGERFSFLGFEYRRIRSRNGVWRPYYAPKLKKRTALFAELREIFRRNVSQQWGPPHRQTNRRSSAECADSPAPGCEADFWPGGFRILLPRGSGGL
jgi:RNA-directed DNA polymerase